MEWQPIETAPSGTLILTWSPYDTYNIDRFNWVTEIAETVESESYNAKGRRRIIQEHSQRQRQWMMTNLATHWMPLPEPPTVQHDKPITEEEALLASPAASEVFINSEGIGGACNFSTRVASPIGHGPLAGYKAWAAERRIEELERELANVWNRAIEAAVAEVMRTQHKDAFDLARRVEALRPASPPIPNSPPPPKT